MSAGFLATLSTWFRDLVALGADVANDRLFPPSSAWRTSRRRRRQEGGLADCELLLSFGDLEDRGRGTMEEQFGGGARSEFRLAESLWMDVLETSLSGMGMSTS